MINVQFFAAFADSIGKREMEFPHKPGLTCADLWDAIRRQYPDIASIPALFAIGEEYVPKDAQLNDGDSIMIFPPVSGGAPRFIYETPLSVQRAIDAIRDDQGGGEAFFVGRIRSTNEGHAVRFLHYECQVPMSEKQIGKIIDEMFAKWALLKVHIEHRIGKLEVGDLAVIVAVSAEHRREALEACRYGIDELKHRVPIWKKEVSETGEVWVGACAHEEGEKP